MKSLRRSFNKDPPPISTPISTYPTLSKPAIFQQPPKKVIRCIQAYRQQSPQELSCAIGDFLYVSRELETPSGAWYEVTSPVNNSRGIVPMYCFEELPKNGPDGIQAGPNARLPPAFNRASTATSTTLKSAPPKHQTFYAIVQYDFSAERPDELDAKAGEPISVVAQSNREWFVAKPIGRLGGPGLIPVSFVEIRDPLTNLPVKDVDGLMDRGVLPRVEEWKQATAEYKASSIPLGVLDDAAVGEGVKDSPFMKQTQGNGAGSNQTPPQQYNSSRPPQHDRSMSQATNQSRAVSHAEPEPPLPPPSSTSDLLPVGFVLTASIPSFHYENDEYWFRIDATYQTVDQIHTYQLVLYRNYDDFYEFQIALLDAFPTEAGRKAADNHSDNGYPTPPSSVEEPTRILPYMPGPVSFVDDMITSVRRTELDQYLGELCELQHRGAGYVLQHELVRSFFSAKSGDVVDEVDTPPPQTQLAVERTIPEEEGEGVYTPLSEQQYGGYDPQEEDGDDVADHMDQMHISQQAQQQQQPSRTSYDGYAGAGKTRSGYGNEYDRSSGYSGTGYDRQSRGSSSPHKNGGPLPRVQGGDSRPGSLAGGGYSDPHSGGGGHNHSYSYSSMAGGSSTLSPPINQHPYSQGGGSRSARSSSGNTNDGAGGSANHSPNMPSSESSSSPAFLKIKIFHSESDDLIAIRVPPKVTYSQLMQKVQDRLGPEVSVIRYRDSFDTGGGGSTSWRGINGDADLRQWIGKGDKLVLYAD